MVWLKIRFCGYIREISDSAQAITARSQKNKFSKIQNWLTLHSQTIFLKIQVNYFNISQFFVVRFWTVGISSRKRICACLLWADRWVRLMKKNCQISRDTATWLNPFLMIGSILSQRGWKKTCQCEFLFGSLTLQLPGCWGGRGGGGGGEGGGGVGPGAAAASLKHEPSLYTTLLHLNTCTHTNSIQNKALT